MSEELLVSKVNVNYSGRFNLKKFYRFLSKLFSEYNYTINENVYKYSASQKLLEIEWKCTREIDDYTQFKIMVWITGRGMEKVKVKKGDVIEEYDKGDIDVTMKAFLVTDYNDKWENNPILKFLKGIYEKYLYKSTLDQLQEKILSELYSIQNEIKSFFNLSRMM